MTPYVWFLAVVVAFGLLAMVCVPHPVGAARTFEKYEGKAATTVKGSLSDVATVSLVANTRLRGRSLAPYAATVVSDAEEQLSKHQGTFDSIQPPNGRADRLQREVDELLSRALDDVRRARVVTRRNDRDGLRRVASALRGDAKTLNEFVERHQ